MVYQFEGKCFGHYTVPFSFTTHNRGRFVWITLFSENLCQTFDNGAWIPDTHAVPLTFSGDDDEYQQRSE